VNELSKSNAIKNRRNKKIFTRSILIFIFLFTINLSINYGVWIFVLKEENIPLIILIFVLSTIVMIFLAFKIEKVIGTK